MSIDDQVKNQAERPLNAQQISALQKQAHTIVTEIRRDVELRKLAIDYAFKLAGERVRAAPDLEVLDVIKLAGSIHDFITSAALREIAT